MNMTMNMKSLALLTLVGVASGELRYHVTDLSGIDGDIVPVVGYCINGRGDVAGHGVPLEGGGRAKPFLYKAESGKAVNLGNLIGSFNDGYGGNGYAINSAGVVVGRNSISDDNYEYRPFLYSDSNNDGYVNTGEMVDLTAQVDYGYGWAESINDIGQVVGFGANGSGVNQGWLAYDADGNMRYTAEEIMLFPESYYPTCINNESSVIMASGGRAYIWRDGDYDRRFSQIECDELPLPDGYIDSRYGVEVTIESISPVVINNSGSICGAAENNYGRANGFFWQDTNRDGLIDVDEYIVFGSVLKYTHVRAMNDHDQIVGGTYEFGGERSAFIWTKESGFENLNTLADSSDVTIGARRFSQAEGINNTGQIVVSGGYDTDGNGRIEKDRTFILTPYYTGDIDGDGKVDLCDFALFAGYYLKNDEDALAVDFDESGVVDLNDLEAVLDDWLSYMVNSN